ncbi:unnamed protein product [Rhizophagus irregularis]|uniref:Uncharacterized protein n=1 Tax=Rhizophagus irregularis TaxID=588596 RepID=A0A916EJ98_9GLOM|nr:unnamed protein product [Rhizophagus irregularis]
MEEILSQSKAINPDYVTDSTSDSPPISDGENSDNKENYKAYETRKKKRKSTGIEDNSFNALNLAFNLPKACSTTTLCFE